MNNQERDRYLTEQMGECWHEWEGNFSKDSSVWFYKCKKCGYEEIETHLNMRGWQNNFSTWEDFGICWEWVIKQTWFDEFCGSKPHKAWTYPIGLINPDRFANAVYEFLKDK